MRLINAYTVRPGTIQEGDVMCFVIKAIVIGRDVSGILRYRLYRCPWEGNDVPQGNQILHSKEVCEALFPSLDAVGWPDETL